jgi:hypothetical protein
MRAETVEFIESWELKLSQIDSPHDRLKELYDKFTTLYTIYNRLYNEAFYQMEINQRLIKQRYSDYEKATSIVIDFLSPKTIIKSLAKNDNVTEIEKVSKLINNVFHINLAEGIPDINSDKQLASNLQSKSPDVKSKAVLSLLYNVRCNIVHGYKEFKEHQRLIVEPLVELLETLIPKFKEKLISGK